jgi:IMP dehydrogenase
MDGVVSPSVAIRLGQLGGLGVLNLEGLWTRYDDPEPLLTEIASCRGDRHRPDAGDLQRADQADLITARVKQIRDAGVTVAASLTPQRTVQFAQTVLDSGVDLFVIQGTVVSAEHVSSRSEPLNLKRFIADLDVPVLVGGCATYMSALHLMRTGAAGILVGVGPGQANTTRGVLGLGVPMATSIADAAGARRDYLDESGGRYVHVIAGRRHAHRRRPGQGHRLRRRRRHARQPAGPRVRGARPRLPLGPRSSHPSLRAAPG